MGPLFLLHEMKNWVNPAFPFSKVWVVVVFFFFLMWIILKSLLNLLQYCFCFMFLFLFFGLEACGLLTSQPGIEPAAPMLEGEVLTIGPPGKSQNSIS